MHLQQHKHTTTVDSRHEYPKQIIALTHQFSLSYQSSAIQFFLSLLKQITFFNVPAQQVLSTLQQCLDITLAYKLLCHVDLWSHHKSTTASYQNNYHWKTLSIILSINHTSTYQSDFVISSICQILWTCETSKALFLQTLAASWQ